VNPAQLWRKAVEEAGAAIRSGGVAAIPTDTVYGLAADPFQPEAVQRLLRLKQRPDSKPILLLIESLRQAELLSSRFPAAFERLAARFWPGPLTVVLPAAPAVPEAITAGTGTVAVRVPGTVLTREIIRAARVPLTGTSANISGRPAAESAAQVREQFPSGLALVVDGGPAAGGAASTIVDLTGEPRILREGRIPAAEILCLCQGG
jgi:L-threonylcarbamoyladenylate synthase